MGNQDTIIAPVTPPFRAGVGIIRLSGEMAKQMTQTICRVNLKPRFAHYCSFYDKKNNLIDMGLCLYFKGPHSFTGEDIVEWQVHGSPVVIDQLLQTALSLGARLAEPGEFSKRAFLNDKMDLTQAEAVSDLIHSCSIQSARLAVRSLQGEFSKTIHQLTDQLIDLRVYIESAIDFVDEEIELLNKANIGERLEALKNNINRIIKQAKNSVCLQEGLHVVIVGKPNAGKSSLLNCLSGRESAIVTNLPGTTRDILRETIQIGGIPLHIIDTAGLRDQADTIEKEGIKRALDQIQQADLILLVQDGTEKQALSPKATWQQLAKKLNLTLTLSIPIVLVENKIDLTGQKPEAISFDQDALIRLSVKEKVGIDLLHQQLRKISGYQEHTEGEFLARRRHLDSLEKASNFVKKAQEQILAQALECVAEELRQAQLALNTITGEFTSDDLLGQIFNRFCIGK